MIYIVSNAFWSSIKTISVRRPESKPLDILSVKQDTQISVKWFFRNPDWN